MTDTDDTQKFPVQRFWIRNHEQEVVNAEAYDAVCKSKALLYAALTREGDSAHDLKVAYDAEVAVNKQLLDAARAWRDEEEQYGDVGLVTITALKAAIESAERLKREG